MTSGGGNASELAWVVGMPVLVMGVFWMIAAAMVWFPEFGTRQGRVHYADAVQTLSGGSETAIVRDLRAAAAGVPVGARGKDGKE